MRYTSPKGGLDHAATDAAWRTALAAAADAQGFHLAWRTDDKPGWDAALRASGHAPALLTAAALDFQIATNADRHERLVDLTCYLTHDGKAIAALPLGVTWDRPGAPMLSTCGLENYAPFLALGTPRKQLRKACALIHDINQWLTETLALPAIVTRHAWSPARHQSAWLRHERDLGAMTILHDELLVDLGQPYDRIHVGFRKSYRPLVTRAASMWDVRTDRAPTAGTWQEFHDLHVRVAGRETRSAASWEAQFNAFSSGNAMLATVRDDAGEMVGAAFFFLSRDEAAYAVAAYRRDLFDQPIGHGAQAAAIRAFQQMNIPWYWIGTLDHPRRNPKLTEKEIAIMAFKAGFASDVGTSFSCSLDRGGMT